MKNIKFCKYQGTGNDFVIIDNRSNHFFTEGEIAKLCDRKFGVGADGLMLLENHPNADFCMRYFNSDGQEATMCGNGGRCIVSFAHKIGVINNETIFLAVDGLHKANVKTNGEISLQMSNVDEIAKDDNAFILDTGSPHYVQFVDDVNTIDAKVEGAKIRNNSTYIKNGINVNFVEIQENSIYVRTYERGVEDLTLSCGTGVVASAIATGLKTNKFTDFNIQTDGGNLKVSFDINNNNKISNIFLQAEATFVFEGTIAV